MQSIGRKDKAIDANDKLSDGENQQRKKKLKKAADEAKKAPMQ